MKEISPAIKVRNQWDKLSVEVPNESDLCQAALSRLRRIPGISHIEEVAQIAFTDFDTLLAFVLAHREDVLMNRSFAVRVKRKGKHDFSSQELAAYIGGGICARVAGSHVQLKDPQQLVKIWLDQDEASVEIQRYAGLGGYPIPTQETALSLISGGFDSAVATYAMMRRGARTHFCFFNLGGAEAHEAAVKEVSYFLWERFSKSHAVKFVSVDFSEVVNRILIQDQPSLMGVLLKRAMLRASALVAERVKAQAVVTGEALGQVSSQTLSNLKVIDEVTPMLVLRPLIVSDKQDIVNQAHEIGVGQMAAAIPEYCGVISNKPTVKAQRAALLEGEQTLTDELIAKVVHEAQVIDIREVPKVTQETAKISEISSTDALSSASVVLDIRAPEEEERAPLTLNQAKVKHVPFFKLTKQIENYSKDQELVLYCDQGVMSRMQALRLREQGFQNVSVLSAVNS